MNTVIDEPAEIASSAARISKLLRSYEYLDVFVRTRGKQTLIDPLILATTRPTRAWTFTPAAMPGRVDIAAGRSVQVTAELSGSPERLLLAMWGRLNPDEAGLTISGDPLVAASLTGRP